MADEMEVESISTLDRYKAELVKVENSTELDEPTRQLYKSALETKIAATERADLAKADRIKKQLFIDHFINGCPECKHMYRASAEEVTSALKIREMSGMKL